MAEEHYYDEEQFATEGEYYEGDHRANQHGAGGSEQALTQFNAVPRPDVDGGFHINNKTDFTIVPIYLQEGGIQIASDGRQGFYYSAPDRGGGLRFVQACKSVRPYAHYLRAKLPQLETKLEQLKSEVEMLKDKLKEPDFDDAVQRQVLSNKMGMLETKIRVQYKEWESKSAELDEEEEKGTLIYYSTADTDGIIVDEETIHYENPKETFTDEILREEALEVQTAHSQIDYNYFTVPATTSGVFTKSHEEDVAKIAEIQRRWKREEIEKATRGNLYDLSGKW
eukprot:g4635.t1